MSDAVRIDGLREFQKALRAADAGLPKMVRLVGNEAAGIVVDYARPKIPTKSGRAAGSVKVRSSQRSVGVAVGGKRAPYYPWLDFGGQGRVHGRPGKREFRREGRYLYPALRVKREEFTAVMARGLTELAVSAGLEVT
jgi:hypothetical protein